MLTEDITVNGIKVKMKVHVQKKLQVILLFWTYIEQQHTEIVSRPNKLLIRKSEY